MRLFFLSPVMVALALALTACTPRERAAIRTALDIARDLCVLSQAEQLGIKPEDVAKAACDTEQKVRPWLPHVLAAQQAGAVSAGVKAP